MFDGHFRANAEQKLQPVGAQLKRTGISADHLTLLGIVMALCASVAIGAGAVRHFGRWMAQEAARRQNYKNCSRGGGREGEAETPEIRRLA